MTGRRVALAERMSVREFEMCVPAAAEVRRMRIEEKKVSFAMGRDREGTVEILWNSRGRAFVRPIARQAVEMVEFATAMAKRFNGYTYYRRKEFDLILIHNS